MTNSRYLVVSLAVGVAAALAGCGKVPAVSYQNDVAKVLGKYCAECHMAGGEGAQASGFEVGSYEAVMKGTKFGPVVVAGDSASSSLYRLVAGKVDKSIQMPHGKEKLADTDIAIIQNWIDQGAKNN